MAEQDYIIIVGCGRLGSVLANKLSSDGNEIVVIDRNPGSFDKLSSEFSGFTITGEASEQSVLKQAEIERADFVFAVTSEDNANLMIAQIANRIFDVEHVVARIDDTQREQTYREFGIETISPTHLTMDAFISKLEESRKTNKS